MENREIVYTDDLFEKLDDSEKNSEFIAVESKTFLKDAWDRFKKNKIALAGLIFLVVMVILVIFVPLLSPYSYEEQNIELKKCNAKSGPSVWNGSIGS